MSIQKLRLLFRRQWIENSKSFAFFTIATAGALAVLFMMTWHWRDSFSGAVNNGIFLIGLFVVGALFGNAIFKELGSDQKNTWHLSLPASAGEKLVIAVLYGVVLYIVAYVTLFYVVEGFHVWLVNRNGVRAYRADLFRNGFYRFVFFIVKFQLFIMLGSLYFRKLALLKTILLVIVCFFLITQANLFFLKVITGEPSITSAIPFDYFQFVFGGENVYVNLPPRIGTATSVLLDYCFPVFLLYLIYIKYTETEL